MSDLQGPVLQWPVVLSALALVLLVAGPLIRLPLCPTATLVTYIGSIIGILGIVWFVTVYPE